MKKHSTLDRPAVKPAHGPEQGPNKPRSVAPDDSSRSKERAEDLAVAGRHGNTGQKTTRVLGEAAFMKVFLNAGPHTDGSQAMAEFLETMLAQAIGHYAERVTRVEAHLSDAIATGKGEMDEVHCLLEAHPVGLAPVIVEARAASAHQAMHGAVAKLERSLERALGKNDPRHRAKLAGERVP